MRHILFNSRQFLESYINLPLNGHIPPVTSGREVALITGSTGFIGGFLLKELIRKKAFRKYICLVRSENPEAGYQKLLKRLQKKGVTPDFVADHVEVVCGDVTQPQLGLSPARFDELAGTVDAVYHFAATMNWISPFNQETTGNIQALKEALNFCTLYTTKPLHYASSIGSWLLLDQPDGDMMEDEIHDQGHNVVGGYCQSKWINEKLCEIGREHGIPINVYRIGDVKGASSDGFGDPNNFINIVMRYFIEHDVIFESEEATYNFLPVDYVAEAIAHISLQNTSRNFQFSNPEQVSMNDIYHAASLAGHSLKFVSKEKWLDILRADGTKGRMINPIFRPFRPGAGLAATTFFDVGIKLFRKKHDTTNTDRMLTGSNILCPRMVSDKVLNKYMVHLSEQIQKSLL